MGGKRKRLLNRDELRGVLLAISDEHLAGRWAPTLYDFDRWVPKGVSDGRRHMSRLAIVGAAGWRRLAEELTGRATKSRSLEAQERVGAAKAVRKTWRKSSRPLDEPVGRLPASELVTVLVTMGEWPVIGRWRAMREWDPVRLGYVVTGVYSTWEVR
jgi:hypothetical protein